jgi:hypothetical protein
MLSCCSVIFFTHPSTSSPQHFLFPSAAPRRTSAATPGRHRQPPTPPPSHDPVLLEHHRNSLQLTDPPNFPFSHPSFASCSAGELNLRRRSASPSTRRDTAPQPRVPAALHHPAEAIQLLLHYPPTPQPVERRAAIAARENPSRPTVDDSLPPHLRPN